MVHAYSILTKINQNILKLAVKQVLIWQQRNKKKKWNLRAILLASLIFKMNIFNAIALQIYLNIDSNISSVRYGYGYLYLKNLWVVGVLKKLMSILIFQYQHSNVVICFIFKSTKLISTWAKQRRFDSLLCLYI